MCDKTKIEEIYQVEVRRARSEILRSPDGRIAKRKAEFKNKRNEKETFEHLHLLTLAFYLFFTKITLIILCNYYV